MPNTVLRHWRRPGAYIDSCQLNIRLNSEDHVKNRINVWNALFEIGSIISLECSTNVRKRRCYMMERKGAWILEYSITSACVGKGRSNDYEQDETSAKRSR